jgi:hypothetical protein
MTLCNSTLDHISEYFPVDDANCRYFCYWLVGVPLVTAVTEVPRALRSKRRARPPTNARPYLK